MIALLNFRGVQLSARTGTILGTFEILVFVALAVWLIIKAGSANTGQRLHAAFRDIKGFKGFSGIAAGSIYTILAFIGFEASAPLAEEARNPRRTIQVAVVTSCLVIGLFYVLTTYAGDVFYGPQRFASFGELNGGSPWIGLARSVWGVGWVVVFLAIVNSTFANGNAGTLATTRTWYAMARIGVLPSPLARTHPQWKSPYVGVIVQLVLTLAIGLPIGIHFGPVTGFVFLATILTGVMIVIYMVFNLSCIMFYLRRARSEFNVLLHLVVPVLGIVAFLPAWFTALGIGGSVPEIRRSALLPIKRNGACHRNLVHHRDRRPDLPVRASSRAAARDEAGVRRRAADRRDHRPARYPVGDGMKADEGYIEVPGGRVWYRSVGEGGTPLLCLHGGPGFTHYYLEPLEALADRRQVIFYDQLGCGQLGPSRPTPRSGRYRDSSRNSSRCGRRSG